MSIPYTIWGLVGLALATGLVAGVFLTFSDFVMRSLATAQPAAGAEAMQMINRKVYRSLFMVLLMGMVPVSVTLAIYALLFVTGPAATALMAAGVLYFFGVFVVTAAGNVPMNQKLDAMPLGGGAAQAYWPDYVKGWTLWNHVRWVAALGATGCYIVSAVLLAAAR